MPLLRAFLQRLEDLGGLDRVFLLIGVGPLRSAKAAEWMRQNVPGIHIPDALIERLRGAQDAAREGRNICIELIQEARAMKGVHGVHVMAYRQEETVAEIIDRSGVLEGRVPWYPGRDRQTPQGTDTQDKVAS
jgi:methylenetetrahydrofolate reductase (NADPH)